MFVLLAGLAWADIYQLDAPCFWIFHCPLGKLSNPGSDVAAGMDARYIASAKNHHL